MRPDRVPNWRFQRAFGAAGLAAIGCALLWMLAARSMGSGAPFVVALAGGLVGAAARAAARARGSAVQAAALLGFILFFLFGEVLLFQKALLPRLVAMHAREGAADPELEARHEIDYVERLAFDEKIGHFLRVEVTLGLFIALGAGGGLALLLTRAPLAVAAFEERRRARIVAVDPDAADEHTGTDGFETADPLLVQAGDEPLIDRNDPGGDDLSDGGFRSGDVADVGDTDCGGGVDDIDLRPDQPADSDRDS